MFSVRVGVKSPSHFDKVGHTSSEVSDSHLHNSFLSWQGFVSEQICPGNQSGWLQKLKRKEMTKAQTWNTFADRSYLQHMYKCMLHLHHLKTGCFLISPDWNVWWRLKGPPSTCWDLLVHWPSHLNPTKKPHHLNRRETQSLPTYTKWKQQQFKWTDWRTTCH